METEGDSGRAAATTNRRCRRTLRHVSAAGGGLLLALLITEGLVRLHGGAGEVKTITLDAPESAYQRSRNPLLAYELKRDYRNDAPDLRRTFERTNAHGLRDRPRSHARPAGIERRVLLLGDSVVEGHGVAESDTISSHLERILADERTEVLNFGVSGYNTRAEVALLAERGLAFAPDVVVLLFVHNDFNREALRLEATPRPGWANALFERSHLFRFAALRFDFLGFSADLDPTGWNRRAMGQGNVTAGLRELERLADEHGFTALVAVWPTFLDQGVIDTGGVDERGRPLPSRDGRTPPAAAEGGALVIEHLAAANGLAAVRLSPYFALDAGRNPRLEWTNGDRTHPSAAGCRRAAQALADVLRRHAAGELHPTRPPAGPTPEGIERELGLGGSAVSYARVLVNDGVRHLDEGRLDEAIAALTTALEQEDSRLAAHYNLALTYLRKGESADARRHFEAALRVDPESSLVHAGLGALHSREGRLEPALEHLERALGLRPDDPRVAANLGGVLVRSGRFEQAERLFRSALAGREASPAVHVQLARLLERRGETAQARAHYLRALELAPADRSAAQGLRRVVNGR
ncbi:MAG: hypothetical protein CMJ84_07445 [Planctomycetes bacterium]|jgi:Flp pilus assembly protein TadD/lysophospholipase L1-like esterase|nr:hypothetical protein [Planctomycetota bacterium]MDP6410414.1 tetratricopeptide repeat protein [Planctomycetota bacterium]